MKEIIEMLLEFSRDLRSLNEKLSNSKERLYEQLSEEWFDSRQVMDILKISKRSLQYMRNHGDLLYSKVKGKCYYSAREVKGLLERGGRREEEGERRD
jgi:hypothetical protein